MSEFAIIFFICLGLIIFRSTTKKVVKTIDSEITLELTRIKTNQLLDQKEIIEELKENFEDDDLEDVVDINQLYKLISKGKLSKLNNINNKKSKKSE